MSVETSSSFREKLLAEALSYHVRGLCVLPIWFGENAEEKKPTVKWKKFQTERPYPHQLKDWFTQRTNTQGIGFLAGPVSGGVAERDFDTEAGYSEWCEQQPILCRELPTFKTKRGFGVLHRSDFTGYIELNDGEYRASANQMTVLPHSVRPIDCGTFTYEWVIPLPKGPLPQVEKRVFVPDSYVLQNNQCRTEHTDTQDTQIRKEVSVCLCVCVSSVDQAIELTMPTAEGQRHSCIFRLARALKSLPEYRDSPASMLRPVFQRWHEQALPNIGTKDFSSSWSDFCWGWDRVRYPVGEGKFADLLAQADASVDPKCAEQYDAPGIRRLVRLCRELNRASDPYPFFISVRTAAAVMGMDDIRAASKRMGMLCSDGVLKLVQQGIRPMASQYLYIGGTQ